MIVVLAFVWGGFGMFVLKAVNKERSRRMSPRSGGSHALVAILGIGALVGLGACGDGSAGTSDDQSSPELTEAQARTAQFSPVDLSFDASVLDDRQKQVVRHLVDASQELDMAFRLQKWAGRPPPGPMLWRPGNTTKSCTVRGIP